MRWLLDDKKEPSGFGGTLYDYNGSFTEPSHQLCQPESQVGAVGEQAERGA